MTNAERCEAMTHAELAGHAKDIYDQVWPFISNRARPQLVVAIKRLHSLPDPHTVAEAANALQNYFDIIDHGDDGDDLKDLIAKLKGNPDDE